MRVILQRVKQATVTINGNEKKSISQGLMILVGIEYDDELNDIDWLCGKICKLRIFADEQGVMNLSIQDINGELLIVSQFTLHASTKKGNRPSYIRAARPEIAIPLYEKFIEKIKEESGLKIETGEFGADMLVEILNDGPVTIIMDSKQKE
jgi:D-tyrosyl-tRNA(Tyr) deacylase